jgi:hypothetical protein
MALCPLQQKTSVVSCSTVQPQLDDHVQYRLGPAKRNHIE